MAKKFLCINDSGFKSNKLKKIPKFGEVYTLVFSRKEPSGRIGYVLDEIRNPYFYSIHWGECVEPTFDSARFVEWDEELIEEKYEQKFETA